MPRCGDSNGLERSQSIALVGACPPSAMVCSFFAKKEPKKFQRKRHGPATMPFCVFAGAGVRAHPNLRWRIGKTDGKTVSPGVFPGFCLRGYAPQPRPGYKARCKPTQRVGSEIHGPGTGAIAPPQAVPRASECGAFCLRGHAPQSRPRNKARCKNQRSALVPTFTAPEPGPLSGLPNLPSPLVGQKGTFRNRPGA